MLRVLEGTQAIACEVLGMLRYVLASQSRVLMDQSLYLAL